jgi:TatD DNase family protein
MLIDSHCHLDYFSDEELPDIFANAKNLGVEAFLSACADVKDFPRILEIANKWPNVFCSVGNHPTENVQHELSVDEIITLATNSKVVAIGEIGLDYHYDNIAKEQQKTRFITHIEAALEVKKPIIVHTREAKADTLQILRSTNAEMVGGIIHCFTEDRDFAEQALAMGFYISFSGIVTFPKAQSIQEVAKLVPLDKLLVETDSPYLAPVLYRGKTNQPGFVRYVAEYLATLRDISFTALAEATTDNFIRLFGDH